MLHSIQYLRAVASLMVVVHHVREQNPAFMTFFNSSIGSSGVDIFFVISGFIMMWVSVRPTSQSNFLISRVVRVAPLYWIFTTLMMVLLLVFPNLFNSAIASLSQYIASLLFIPVEAPDGRLRPLLTLGWTLNYEMYFYLVFSFFLLLKPARRCLAVAGSLIVL